jgi:hypothetical protein
MLLAYFPSRMRGDETQRNTSAPGVTDVCSEPRTITILVKQASDAIRQDELWKERRTEAQTGLERTQ